MIDTRRAVYLGKRFRLNTDLPGIEELANGGRQVVNVPAGEVISVLSERTPADRRLVDVRWGERKLIMFVDQIEKCGQEVGFQRFFDI